MATSINVRLSDEIEKKLKDTVNKVKKDTPTGAEVNNSTIVRGALEEFFNKIENERNGMKSISYNLSDLSINECKKVQSILENEMDKLKGAEKGSAEEFMLKIIMSLYLSVNEKYMNNVFKKIDVLKGEK